MLAEAAEELCAFQLHDLLLAAVAVIFVAEGYAFTSQVDESVVGDGGLMGVSAEVFDDAVGAVERGFGIDDPSLAPPFAAPGEDGFRHGGHAGWKREFAGDPDSAQAGKEDTTKDFRQSFDREEKASWFVLPLHLRPRQLSTFFWIYPGISLQSTARNDAVQMGMKT